MSFNRKDVIFTREELEDIFHILECSSISIIDIRHHLVSPTKVLKDYRFPSSAFVFVSGGKGEVLLGDTSYSIRHFSLFHGGKGTTLSIFPYCDCLEYYMILYKGEDVQSKKKEFKKLLLRINPYQVNYGFAPQNPILIMDMLSNMHEHWNQPNSMERFYEKSLFYQLVYEIYKELSNGNIETFDSDIVGITIRYMNQNYSSSIAVQDICKKLGISYSHFYRLFKKEVGTSFQGYLSKIRLEKARQYIINSNYSLGEIAVFTGFYDEFHLSSAFKKFTGQSPMSLRKILTWDKTYSYMEISDSFYYNEKHQVSYDKPNLEGAYFMLKHFKNQTVIAAALLVMTLSTACSSQPVNSTSENSVEPKATAEQSKETSTSSPSKAETRILSTEKGDVEIPVNPKRVVTDCGLVGNIVALGVTPIAIEDYTSTDVAYKDLIKDSKVLEKWEPEYIMAEEPDLIITMYEENYEQLSEIAPTVYVPLATLSVEDRLSFLADALGKDPAEGKQVVTAYNEKVAEWKTKLEATDLYSKTFSVIRVQGENKIGVRWSNNLGGQILFGALGLPIPESALKEIEGGVDWGTTLSFEALPEYMGDYILVTASDTYGYDLIKDNPIWQSLPAVQAGHVFIFSEPYMYQNDIYSWSSQLDLIGNALLDSTK